MKNFILTTTLAVAAIIGGLTFTETAEARPWRYYRAPAVRYYRPYYYGGYRTYYRPYYGYGSYYGPRAYVGYGYPGYYQPYYGGGVYFRW